MESSILSLPNEIFLEILKSCDSFTQALTFTETCKRIRYIWSNNERSILYNVGKTSIVAFDDAVLAIRAIDAAECRYKSLALQLPLPNKINIHQIEPIRNNPTVDEIIRVFDLKYFIDYMLYVGHEEKSLHIYCLQRAPGFTNRKICRYAPLPPHFSNGNLGDMNYKIYSSMYLFFLVSAVLSEEYWEPFFTQDPRATNMRKALASFLPTHLEAGQADFIDPMNRRLFEDDLVYVRQWAAYNKRSATQQDLDSVFGRLAEYLKEKGRNWELGIDRMEFDHESGRANNRQYDRDAPSGAAIQLLMSLITCHEFFWRVAQRQLKNFSMFTAAGTTDHSVSEALRAEHKKVPAFFLGVHSCLDIYVPATHPDRATTSIELDARFVGIDANGNQLRQISLIRLFQILYGRDTPPAFESRTTDLPFELRFFEYALRRHFGLKVEFTWGFGNSTYSRYMCYGIAFQGAEQFRNDVPGILRKI